MQALPRRLAPAVISMVVLGSCAADSGRIQARPTTENAMGAALLASSEVPQTTSSGRGQATLNYDRTRHRLSWTITYGGLSGTATGVEFHGPAMPGQTAPALLALVPAGTTPTSPLQGAVTISPDQAADLLAGKWYVNLDTAANPQGEIRGQILPK
jgi:hypothetical protein